MKTLEATKTRSVKQAEAELSGAQDALFRLSEERARIGQRLEALFADEDRSLEEAALSGKASGKGDELAKIRARLDELPALNHALRRRLLRLKIELTEMRYEEAEAARVEAIANLDQALENKLRADDEHAAASGQASDAHYRREDLQRGLRDLRQSLERHEASRPGATVPPEPSSALELDPDEEIRQQFASAVEQASREGGDGRA